MKFLRTNFRNSFKAVLVLAALLAFVAGCLRQSAPKADLIITATNTAAPVTGTEVVSDKDYGTFSHSIPEHSQIDCDSCHQRAGDALNLKYAGHDSCIGCHLN